MEQHIPVPNLEEKKEAFARVLGVMQTLRRDCPWDAKQNNQSIRQNTIEEVYELASALLRDDATEIKKECGDVLEQLLFYALFGEEKGQFDMADICHSLADKLVFRHPHVFNPDGSLISEVGSRGGAEADNAEAVTQLWERVKQKEKDGNKTILAGVPDALPALIKAYRMQDKAAGVGFDWPNPEGVWSKVREEIAEFETEVAHLDKEKAEEEFGDVLFSLVNAARLYKIKPDNALEKTNQKFKRRFTYVELKARETGRLLSDLSLDEMDALWNEAKRQGL